MRAWPTSSESAPYSNVSSDSQSKPYLHSSPLFTPCREDAPILLLDCLEAQTCGGMAGMALIRNLHCVTKSDLGSKFHWPLQPRKNTRVCVSNFILRYLCFIYASRRQNKVRLPICPLLDMHLNVGLCAWCREIPSSRDRNPWEGASERCQWHVFWRRSWRKPEVIDNVSTGNSNQAGLGRQEGTGGTGARNQGGSSLCISTNALWQDSNANGYLMCQLQDLAKWYLSWCISSWHTEPKAGEKLGPAVCTCWLWGCSFLLSGSLFPWFCTSPWQSHAVHFANRMPVSRWEDIHHHPDLLSSQGRGNGALPLRGKKGNRPTPQRKRGSLVMESPLHVLWSKVEMWQKWLVAGSNTVGLDFLAHPDGGRPSVVRFDSPLCCCATQTPGEELVERRVIE